MSVIRTIQELIEAAMVVFCVVAFAAVMWLIWTRVF